VVVVAPQVRIALGPVNVQGGARPPVRVVPYLSAALEGRIAYQDFGRFSDADLAIAGDGDSWLPTLTAEVRKLADNSRMKSPPPVICVTGSLSGRDVSKTVWIGPGAAALNSSRGGGTCAVAAADGAMAAELRKHRAVREVAGIRSGQFAAFQHFYSSGWRVHRRDWCARLLGSS
jgi:hypothetical protein